MKCQESRDVTRCKLHKPCPFCIFLSFSFWRNIQCPETWTGQGQEWCECDEQRFHQLEQFPRSKTFDFSRSKQVETGLFTFDQSMINPWSSYAFHCFPLLSILSHAPHAPFRDSLTCFKHHHLPGYTTSGALQNIIVGCLEKPLGGKIFVSFGWIWFYFSQIPFSFFSSHSFSFSVSSSLDIWCQFLLTFGLWRSTFARRSGHTYGPPGHRRCVLFVDDLNMPYVRSRVEDEPWHMAKLTFKVCKEFLVRGSLQVWFPLRLMTTTHRAQSCFSRRWPSDIICHDLSCLPVAPKGLACKKISEYFCGNYFRFELMQVLSYGQVYDRERLDEKKNIVDLLFAACMNPKAATEFSRESEFSRETWHNLTEVESLISIHLILSIWAYLSILYTLYTFYSCSV